MSLYPWSSTPLPRVFGGDFGLKGFGAASGGKTEVFPSEAPRRSPSARGRQRARELARIAAGGPSAPGVSVVDDFIARRRSTADRD